jgi:protein-S-isoprenylcysteine O-methyltransferase Ste14
MEGAFGPDAGRTELARRVGLVLWGLLLAAVCLHLVTLFRAGPDHPALWALELLRVGLIAGSLGLVVYAYAVRAAPRVRAQGWAERGYPLLVLTLGFGFFLFVGEPPGLAAAVVGTSVCTLGWTLTIWAFAHLRGNLSVMAEVRQLVQSGPYRRIRHPLYLGEMINWFGLALLCGGWPVLAYAAGLIALQAMRARIEERKLQAVLGDQFSEYRQRAGFLWPGPGR